MSKSVRGKTIIAEDDDIGKVFPASQIEQHVHHRINLRPRRTNNASTIPLPPRYPSQIINVPSNVINNKPQGKGGREASRSARPNLASVHNDNYTKKSYANSLQTNNLECDCDEGVKQICKGSVPPSCNCDGNNDNTQRPNAFGGIRTRRFSRNNKNSKETINGAQQKTSSSPLVSHVSVSSLLSPPAENLPRHSYIYSNTSRGATNYFPDQGQSPDLTQVPSSEFPRVGHPATLEHSNATMRAPISRNQLADIRSRVSSTIAETIKGVFHNFSDTFPAINSFSVTDLSSPSSTQSSSNEHQKLPKNRTTEISFIQIIIIIWLLILTYLFSKFLKDSKNESQICL